MAAAEAASQGNVIAKAQLWWLRGAEADQAWMASSAGEKFFYEIGQKTLNAENWAKFGHITDPIERGKAIWAAQGYGALVSEGHGVVLGAGKTLSTGPTPGARLFVRASGAAGGTTGEVCKVGDAAMSSLDQPQ